MHSHISTKLCMGLLFIIPYVSYGTYMGDLKDSVTVIKQESTRFHSEIMPDIDRIEKIDELLSQATTHTNQIDMLAHELNEKITLVTDKITQFLSEHKHLISDDKFMFEAIKDDLLLKKQEHIHTPKLLRKSKESAVKLVQIDIGLWY